MTKDEILNYFKDINHAYNESTRYDELKRMLDELTEPCEAVSRQAVMDALCDGCELFHKNGEQICLSKCEEYHFLVTLPPVIPKPKTGHWEQFGNSWEDKFKCSECGKEQPKILCGERIIGHWSDYCPNCGADMRESEDT